MRYTSLDARQIADAASAAISSYERGGVIALLILAFIAMFVCFQFGWIVPQYVYKRSEKVADDATATVKSLTESFKALTEEVRELRRTQAERRAR